MDGAASNSGNALTQILAPEMDGEDLAQRRVRAVRNQYPLAEGRRLTGLLADAGVTAVVIKGPALSDRLFGAPGLRDHADIDLVVRPEDAQRAMDVVGGCGYEGEVIAADSPVLRGPCENAFRKGGAVPGMVEVHWRLYPRHLPFPRKLELDVLWPRLGAEFEENDLALYLCFHWVKEWEGIDKLKLFAAALDQCAAFPWAEAVREAEAEGTLRMLLLGG